jgi:hypothetical protein
MLQVVLVTAVCGQDDSSAVKTVSVEAIPVQDSPVIPPPVVKKTAPAKRVAEPVQPPPVSSDSVPEQSRQIFPGSFVLYGNAILPYITNHPYYSVGGDVAFMPSRWYTPGSKDELFYTFCGILFFLGTLKIVFPKYFQDIFNTFWRPAIRQKQIRDQLQQAGMTSLLFNIFFVFSAALFSYLLINYITKSSIQPWLLFAVCFFSITFIYVGKYFVLKLTGWMFGQQTAIDSYIFIVFLINKILSILLIPLMLILAFGDHIFQRIAFTVSLILLSFLLIYRFILSFSGLHNELKISWLHLFLYVCGFEVIPVLLIYKLLLRLFAISS